MTNPIGVSPRSGPPQGLDYCGTFLPGGISNFLGSQEEPAPWNGVFQNGDGFWYARPEGDVFLTDGGPMCSPTPMNASHADGTLVPYVAQPLNTEQTHLGTSDLAAGWASGSSCEFVSLQLQVSLGLDGGFAYCSGVTDPSTTLHSLAFQMGGATLELLPNLAPGGAFPGANVALELLPLSYFTGAQPAGGWNTNVTVMRPTALTWGGQDPDNIWNRAIFHRSEISTLTWSLVTRTWGWACDIITAVVGWRLYTQYPTPCTVRPPPPPEPPKQPTTVKAGASKGGQVRSRRHNGATATGPPVFTSSGSGWVTVGATYYNDPPPGAGNLSQPGYHFAELGTARRTDGGGTGVGWVARALGMTGELPMGFQLEIEYNGRTIVADKQDRGYGQGGDGITSDPSYAVDLWDGSGSGWDSASGALGFPGGGTIRIRPH